METLPWETVMDSYERILAELDENERLIFPWMYKSTPWLYDKIETDVWLVLFNGEITWATDTSIRHVLEYGGTVLTRMLLVRVRPAEGLAGDPVTYEHYQANKDRYDVLDMRLMVVEKEPPFKTCIIAPEDYKEMKPTHEIIDVMYYVRTKGDTDE